MSVDYLRYLAFEGRFADFFERAIYSYIAPHQTSGQHIRFSRREYQERMEFFWRYRLHDSFINHKIAFEFLEEIFGVRPDFDPVIKSKYSRKDVMINRYIEINPPKIEIIVDVKSEYWDEFSKEELSYEGANILFRKSDAADAHVKSGDRIALTGYKNTYGTLGGFIALNEFDTVYGLTCGHVVQKIAPVSVQQARSVAGFKFNKKPNEIGKVSKISLPGKEPADDLPQAIGTISSFVDAALTAIEPKYIRFNEGCARQCLIKPIPEMVQGEYVGFNGAGRGGFTEARIAAVTVRKSINLYGPNAAIDLRDVLMLGHRSPKYFVRTVSAPGDSGASVLAKHDDQYAWYAMIIGSDDCAAYATYSEVVMSWAADVLRNRTLSFYT